MLVFTNRTFVDCRQTCSSSSKSTLVQTIGLSVKPMLSSVIVKKNLAVDNAF